MRYYYPSKKTNTMKKIFIPTLLLAAVSWLPAQPCTDVSAPFVICAGPLPIDIGGAPEDARAVLFATDAVVSIWDDCSTEEELIVTIGRDIPTASPPSSEVLFFTCDEEGLAIPVFPTATDATGKWDYCFTQVYIQDPMGLCPAGTFINTTSGAPYPSAQSAILDAEEGQTISVLAEEKLGNITTPGYTGVSLTSPESATLPITNLVIGDGGTLTTTGNFTFLLEDVSGSTGGQGTWAVANTGGAETENINLQNLEIDVFTQLSASEGISGGEPGQQINLSAAGGALVLPEGVVAPVGPLSESKSAGSIYTAALITAETPAVEVGLPGPVEDVFGAAAQVAAPRSLTPGLVSPYYVDNTWRIVFPEETTYEAELNFPAALQTGDEVMDIPLVAIRNNGQVRYAFGTPHSGRLLTSAGPVSGTEYHTVSFTGTGTGGDVALFGCPSCGPGKVLICQAPPGNPANARTKCVSKNALITQLKNGSYCGPCVEAAAPEMPESASGSQGLKVYPNPARDRLYLSFDTETVASRRIRLLTLNGRTLREQVVAAGELSAEFSLEDLSAGLYILHIQDGTESRRVKVVVE